MPDSSPATPEERPDLAAMVVSLGRALSAAELPVLRGHRLSMWAYVVLLRLGERPAGTQAALARSIGADKTRIIGTLDELEGRGLIRREPDPADRRARLLSLTDSGREVRAAAQADIRRAEERLMSRLSAADRRGFLRALRTLSAITPAEIAGESAPTAGDAASG